MNMRNLVIKPSVFVLLIIVSIFIPELHALDDVASSPDEICPILVGTSIPDVKLKNIKGDLVELKEVIKHKPAILIFYRGGWCLYCNLHLGQLQEAEPALNKLGYQIIAISPDTPDELQKSIKKDKLNYTLLSDSKMRSAKAFGIAFKVDNKTLQKYNEYGIDLEEASGETHHILPVPSVFIVQPDGVITFEYVNPDYKIRIDPELLYSAAKTNLKQKNR